MWGQDSHVSVCVPLICSPLLSRILPDTWVMTGKIENNQWYLTAKLHGYSIPSAVMVKRKSVKIIWKICASSCQAASISPSSSRDRAALRSLESLEFSVETWRQNETKHFPVLLIWTKIERLMVQWLAFLMVSFCFLVDGCCLFFLPPSYFAMHMLPAAVGRPTKKNEHQQGFFTQGWFSKKRTCDRRSASVGNGRAESLSAVISSQDPEQPQYEWHLQGPDGEASSCASEASWSPKKTPRSPTSTCWMPKIECSKSNPNEL